MSASSLHGLFQCLFALLNYKQPRSDNLNLKVMKVYMPAFFLEARQYQVSLGEPNNAIKRQPMFSTHHLLAASPSAVLLNSAGWAIRRLEFVVRSA